MKYIALIFFSFLSIHAYSQDKYPANYFRSPLDFRLLLSGTFGEIRTNHFHSGIDIKTNGVAGAPVYAIADGYVSRIKVSGYGFGKALYVTHPNGFVSVYGHLNRYNKAVSAYVKREQYEAESFEIELFPEKNILPVKKGDIIAFSGNSGSSGGPHLHFEIRDEASQEPLNPLLFGFDVKDFVLPHITLLKIYPVDENSLINGKNQPVKYTVEGWGTEHRLPATSPVRLSGKITFGIQATDQQNDADNKNGIYSIRMFIDSALVYCLEMERLNFDKARYVNSLIDYREFIANKVHLQRTAIDPNNQLDIYCGVKNNGIFVFDDTLAHSIAFEVKDAAGNVSKLPFNVISGKSVLKNKETDTIQPQKSNLFVYNRDNTFKTDNIEFIAPEGAFYDSFEFMCDSLPALSETYSPVCRIHDEFTPIQDYCTLAIKTASLPDKLKNKALIVKVSDSKSFTSAGGQYEADGFVRTRIREFGDYCIKVDTLPPVIAALNPSVHKNLAGASSVRFSIHDDLSGIKNYRGTINGQWILMEYDPKDNLLIYEIDEHLPPGSSKFRLVVTDMKENVLVYESSFTR